jgi:hypothetical protein
MSLLPVPGGILAGLRPARSCCCWRGPEADLATMMALANQGQPQNPGAAIAPQVEQPVARHSTRSPPITWTGPTWPIWPPTCRSANSRPRHPWPPWRHAARPGLPRGRAALRHGRHVARRRRLGWRPVPWPRCSGHEPRRAPKPAPRTPAASSRNRRSRAVWPRTRSAAPRRPARTTSGRMPTRAPTSRSGILGRMRWHEDHYGHQIEASAAISATTARALRDGRWRDDRPARPRRSGWHVSATFRTTA